MALRSGLLLALLSMLLLGVQACIFEYGTINEAGAIAGGNYTYRYNGLDWPNDFVGCRGQKQSPILLPASGLGSFSSGLSRARSAFSYGILSNGKVTNNGHTLLVSLPEGFTSDVRIPVRGNNPTGTSVITGQGKLSYVKATPAQFHFHSHSEHIVAGVEYPLEMHIVHFIKPDQLAACAPNGCPVVLGILLALTDNEAEVLPEVRRIIEAMPLNEGNASVIAGDLNVGALLPLDRTYLTYEGSLTTPPCTEGVLWHVMSSPIKISQSLLTRFQEAVGDLACPEAGHPLTPPNGPFFTAPPADARGCFKYANGRNYRAVQPINDRPIKMAWGGW